MRALLAVCLSCLLFGAASASRADGGLGLQALDDEVPDFTLRAAEGGEPLTRATLAGRVVLMHFLATWCTPCRQEPHQLDHLAARLDPARFVVVLVSIDTNSAPAEIEAYARSIGVRLPVYTAEGSGLPDSFWGWGLPVSYLIDSHGAFIGRMLGPRDWSDSNLEAAIAQLDRR